MNKKYIVDSEGTVTVITDKGETYTREDKYTESTDMILSLENLSETIEREISVFEKRSNELCNSIRKKDRTIKNLNLALTLYMSILCILTTAIDTKLLSTVMLGHFPLMIIIGILEDRIIAKEKKKRNYCIKQISEKQHRIQKVRRKIDGLLRDKNLKTTNYNNFTEIKPISEYTIDKYTLDASDYFVGNYLIEKRAKEMTKCKKLVKKKPNKKHTVEYEFN